METKLSSIPFNAYEHACDNTPADGVAWLWMKRLPNSGITILDGDRGTGKTILALQIAAAISSGSPLPDGTPTIQGGVVIIMPNTDARKTQIQRLAILGADLSRIEFLSYVHDINPDPDIPDARPFSLPEDFPRLFRAVQRVQARLIIIDNFIHTLSHDRRWTLARLSQLLASFNQQLIERDVACLLIRNCPAKGGHARPSALERSEDFTTNATSHLLIARDPLNPEQLLLTHALNYHTKRCPTLILRIEPIPRAPFHPHITAHGTHPFSTEHFLDHRPDTLHCRLLFDHVQEIVAETPDPMHVSTIYKRLTHSSPSQIQRTLRELLNGHLLTQPARGFYAKAETNPVLPQDDSPSAPSFNPILEQRVQDVLAQVRAWNAQAPDHLQLSEISHESLVRYMFTRDPDAIVYVPEPTNELNQSFATTPGPEPTTELNQSGATTPAPEPTTELNHSGATTPARQLPPELDPSNAAYYPPAMTDTFNQSGATTPAPEPTSELNQSGATTPAPEPTDELNQSGATTLESRLAYARKEFSGTHFVPKIFDENGEVIPETEEERNARLTAMVAEFNLRTMHFGLTKEQKARLLSNRDDDPWKGRW